MLSWRLQEGARGRNASTARRQLAAGCLARHGSRSPGLVDRGTS